MDSKWIIQRLVIATFLCTSAQLMFAQDHLPPEGRLIKRMLMRIETSDIKHAGTDADIYLAISWSQDGEGNGLVYKLPDLDGDDNERGETEIYKFEILDKIQLRNISAIALINGMSQDDPGWCVEEVQIICEDSRRETWFLTGGSDGFAKIGKWLDTKEPNGPIEPLPLNIRRTGKIEIDIPFSSKFKLNGQ